MLALVALLILLCAAMLIELRRLRTLVERLSRARIGVTSLAEIAAIEDAVAKAWDDFLKADAIRNNEENFTAEEQANVAVERHRARRKHDVLLTGLNRMRQAEADVRAGRKTLEQVSAEFESTLSDMVKPQFEERWVYEEALREAKDKPA